jgi:hypothetical protein
MTVGLLISLILTLFNRNYKKSARLWFCLLVGGITLGQASITLIAKFHMGYVLLSLSVGVLYLIPVFFISGRSGTIKEEERQLISFIDGQIAKMGQEERANDNSVNRTINNNASMPIGQVQVLKAKQDDFAPISNVVNGVQVPDFTHVKSVMDRLEYFPLTPADKRQVKDLEVTINMAERGEPNPDLKNKINDGLGALLKIMSKYGV